MSDALAYGRRGKALQQAIWFDGLPGGVLVSTTLDYVQPDQVGTPPWIVAKKKDGLL